VITVTVRTDRYFFASIADSNFFTAQYDCIALVTATMNSGTFLRKLAPPDQLFFGAFPLNSTIARYGNAVYMKAGEVLYGANLSNVTLYITKVD
jgi:hypothetical protein